MALTFERGPLSTTMGQIAERAGVERVTLYRHFGDERGLHRAAAQYGLERFRPPDPAALREIDDPLRRTAAALERLYAHWDRMGPMVRPILRDAELAPDRVSLRLRDEYVEAIRKVVLSGFPAGIRRRRDLRDAVRHAFDFRTWDSLRGGGFGSARRTVLMTALVAAVARPGRRNEAG